MCKPSCCPGTSSGSGLGAAVVVVGAAVIAAAARPIVYAALTVLQTVITITLIAAAALAGLAVLAAVALAIRRACRARQHRHHTAPRPVTGQPRPVLATLTPAAVPVGHHAPFALTAGERARCHAIGADPDQVAQIIAAVLRGPQ